mmetsp:Transcript_42580/g.54745  ORF Transcript_42580/g.54745 Transcript_42580/m.54745 type:complete len:489 (+) Transcript_42580:1347-2813(+)
MRCEACFDWYHPECVSALRRMQVETLLALQRWICRSCFIKNKKYKDAKNMLLNKGGNSKKLSNYYNNDNDKHMRRKNNYSNGSINGSIEEDDRRSSGSEGDMSEGSEEDRESRRRRRPKPPTILSVSSGPSFTSDLNKLLASVDGEGKPRFVRWAHKCEDHACMQGHNDALISEALAQYCMECTPNSGASTSTDTSDMKSVFLDVISALYQRPIFTCRLLFTHGLKTLLWNPTKILIKKYLPISWQLQVSAVLLYIQNPLNSTSTSSLHINHRKRMKDRKQGEESSKRKNGNKKHVKKSIRKKQNNINDSDNDDSDDDNNKMNKQNKNKTSNTWSSVLSKPVAWVVGNTQDVLKNGISILKTGDEVQRTTSNSTLRNDSTSTSNIGGAGAGGERKFRQQKSDKKYGESKKVVETNENISSSSSSSSSLFWDNKDSGSSLQATTDASLTADGLPNTIANNHHRQTRRQKSSRASFSASSTIVSGGGGAW